MARFIVKVGASVLTKQGGGPEDRVLSEIVSDMVRIRDAGNELLVVTSGAIAWGQAAIGLANDFKVEEFRSHGQRGSRRQLLREQVLASAGQPLLMSTYVSLFGAKGVGVAQILVTRADLADQSRYENVLGVTQNLLKQGMVPIFNENDVLTAEEIAFSDNDQLACMLATALKADRMLILTNVDGLFSRPPADPDAVLLEEVDDIDRLDAIIAEGKSQIGKGGMNSKLEAARLVTGFGVSLTIANGRRPGNLAALLLDGKGVGTHFPARGVKIRQRKSWVALAAESRGEIVVSTFLAEALYQGRPSSILVIGVESVRGSFKTNDVVTVKSLDGKVLGRGEVRISSKDLEEKVEQRLRGEEIPCYGSEVIHCDYFVPARQ